MQGRQRLHALRRMRAAAAPRRLPCATPPCPHMRPHFAYLDAQAHAQARNDFSGRHHAGRQAVPLPKLLRHSWRWGIQREREVSGRLAGLAQRPCRGPPAAAHGCTLQPGAAAPGSAAAASKRRARLQGEARAAAAQQHHVCGRLALGHALRVGGVALQHFTHLNRQLIDDGSGVRGLGRAIQRLCRLWRGRRRGEAGRQRAVGCRAAATTGCQCRRLSPRCQHRRSPTGHGPHSTL